jgi:hypothetical protein
MTRPPSVDPTPPPVPPAPEFDRAPTEPVTGPSFDPPGSSENLTPPPNARWPWLLRVAPPAAALLLIAILGVFAWKNFRDRTNAPSVDETQATDSAPALPPTRPAPLVSVPLADSAVVETAAPPNVTEVAPAFLPTGVTLLDVAGREVSGTVTRPEGAWMRVRLAPGLYAFRVSAATDTELHLSDTFNELTFNDDADGLDPAITEQLIGGDYFLWLHIHDSVEDTTSLFTLTIDGPN